MMLTKDQKIELGVGVGVLGGLTYYYYTKSRQVTHPVSTVTRTIRTTQVHTAGHTVNHTVERTAVHTVTRTVTRTPISGTPVTHPLSAPGQTYRVIAQGITATSVALTWYAVSGATSYQILNANTGQVLQTVSGSATSTPVYHLSPGTPYTLGVKACNSAGCGPVNTVTFTTSSATPVHTPVTQTPVSAPTCPSTWWNGLFTPALWQSEVIPSAVNLSKGGCTVVIWQTIINGQTYYALTYSTASASYVSATVFGSNTAVSVVARYQNGQSV